MDLSGRTALVVLTASLGIALVGCSAAAESVDEARAEAPAQTVSQEQPAAAEDDAAENEDPCAATPGNRIDFPHGADGAVFAELRHELIDLGPRDYAGGEVDLDEQGRPVAYTVASGDSPIAIGDRFCVDYITVLQYNRTGYVIDPGEVLSLSPDPTVQWGDSTRPEG